MNLPPTAFAPFRLPFGLLDGRDVLHRDGVLRLPTQKDLIAVLKLAGDVENPAYLEALLLARMLVRLGDLTLDEPGRREVVERLCQPDIEHLNRVYSDLVRVPDGSDRCPHCGSPLPGRGPEGAALDD